MKKLFTFLSVTALSLLFINSSQAQMFQNTNTDCESFGIVDINTTYIGNSVACKNITGAADFTGDGYPDCVIGATETESAGTNFNATAVLNLGTGATDCSSGSGNQFGSPVDYTLDDLAVSPSNLATTVVGPIENAYNLLPAPAADFSIPITTGQVLSMAPNNTFISSGSLVASGTLLADNFTYGDAGDVGLENINFEKTAALFDCENDGDLDEAIVVINTTPDDVFMVNVLTNNGSGFAVPALRSPTGTASPALADDGWAALAVADFDEDGFTDVALVLSDDSGSPNSYYQICLNTSASAGTCEISCVDGAGSPLNRTLLSSLHSGAAVNSSSIVAGDFNNDDNQDIAFNFTTTAGNGVDFLFGDGSGSFPTSTSTDTGTDFPKVLTTGCYDNDNAVDVSASMARGVSTLFVSDFLNVFTSITSAGLATTPLAFGDSVSGVGGIDTADFDQLGGDDIMVAATNVTNNNQRQAFVFMNTVETIVADAGAEVSTEANSVQLTGTCATSPADATAVFDVLWTFVGSSAGATLTGETTLTPTLTSTTGGTYTLQLACATRCTSASDTTNTRNRNTTTVVVTTGDNLFLEGSGVASNGCSSSLSPAIPFSGAGIMMMLSNLVLFWSIRRKK